MNPHLALHLARARTQEALCAATTRGRFRHASAEVRIRLARPDDQAALHRLAALDSSVTPRPPVLVAEVCGELQAAVSMGDSQAIADPFHVTAALVELLRVRAAQLTQGGQRMGAVGPEHEAQRVRRLAARLFKSPNQILATDWSASK